MAAKAHRDLPPLVLRLIVLRRDKQEIYLLTNVFDPEQLSDEEAGVLYEMRWGIEVFYRSYKQTLSRRRLLSRTPATCLAECSWTMLGLWLLGLLTVTRIVAKKLDPLSWSVALARNAVRRAMRAGIRGGEGRRLFRDLALAVKDGYQRRGPKAARDYPRKKREKPPGPPKIQSASPKEVQTAKQLREKICHRRLNGVGWHALSSEGRGCPGKHALRCAQGRATLDGLRPSLLFQHHVTTAVVELDVGHERPHQHHAAPARTVQVGRIGGIRETVGIEAGAFVSDLDPDFFGRKPTTETDVLGPVQMVTVNSGVHQGLVDRQVDAEDVVPRPVQGLQLMEQHVQKLPPDCGVVGKHLVALPCHVVVGSGHTRGCSVKTPTGPRFRRP